VPNPIKEIGGESFPGHFVVHDSTGASVVIEPVDKTLKIYDNPLGVMANSPTFDWHVTNLRNYVNLTTTNVPPIEMSGIKLSQFGQGSGMRGIPGDFTPPSRFVRAVAFSQSAEKLATAEETVPQVFHIMNAFDIPVLSEISSQDSGATR
jgi:choloylglycine hydrolase